MKTKKEIIASQKRWKKENPDKVRAWRQKNYKKNRDKIQVRAVELRNKKYFDIENQYTVRKDEYDQSIIDFKQSPSGRAYIGLAKKPLMPNATGFGYQGVKIQTENRELILCNECGKWFRNLTATHTKKHGLTLPEYKERFGYNKTSALVPDAVSNLMAECVDENRKLVIKKFGLAPHKFHGKGNSKSREYENSKGTCPEQIKDHIINYVKRFKRLPNGSSYRDGFGQYSSAVRQFGSINKALEYCGLPKRHRMGTIVEYNFPDGTQYFKTAQQDYLSMYEIMKERCLVLQS